MRMASHQTLNLCLAAEPESVGVARRAVGEFAETFGMEEPALGDLKTIVTEASSNVVRHAYPSGHGTFEVEADVIEGSIQVVVRDFGEGIRARIPEGEPGLCLGLALISMLSSHYEICDHDRGGTEVRIALRLQG